MRVVWISIAGAMLIAFPLLEGRAMAASPARTEAGSERDFSAKSLDALLEELRAYNPEMRSATAEAKAAAHRIRGAGLPEDPMLGVKAVDIPTRDPDPDRTPMAGYEVELTQTIPFPGKLGLQKKIARSESEAAHAERDETSARIVATFKSLYHDLLYLRDAIAITERREKTLRAAAAMSASRYAAKDGSASMLLASDAESAMLDAERARLDAARLGIEGRLTAMLDRPSGTPFRIAPGHASLTPLSVDPETLESWAIRDRPLLRQAEFEVDAATARKRLARRDLWPDVSLSAAYRVRDFGVMESTRSENYLSTGIALNVPIFAAGKQGERVREESAILESRAAQKVGMRQETVSDVRALYHEIKGLGTTVVRYEKTVVPAFRSAVAIARAAYESGQLKYEEVVSRDEALFKAELELAEWHCEYEKKMAELEWRVGRSPSVSVHHPSQGVQP